LTAHLCARDAHSDADVGELQCGRVVNAVAGHRDYLAPVLQQPHNVLLVPRLGAREHGPLGVNVAAQE
jgi:hypothetical protein